MAKVEEKKGTLRKDDLKDVLREMLLIRRFEEKVEERFRAGELPGFLHVCIGEEASAVGVHIKATAQETSAGHLEQGARPASLE